MMTPTTDLLSGNAELLRRGNEFRAKRATWSEISRQLGLSLYKTRCLFDPGYAEREREKARAGARRRYPLRKLPPLDRHLVQHTVPPWEAARALASVPRDMRSLTGRAFGDPLPGRSALDRRRMGQFSP